MAYPIWPHLLSGATVGTHPRPGVLAISRFNIADICLERWATDPETAGWPALTFARNDGGDLRFTYADIWQRIHHVAANLLAAGLKPGDRVLVRLPHAPEYAFTFFGAILAGLLPIPASPKLTAEEVEGLLEDSGARGIVTREPESAGRPGLLALDPDALARETSPVRLAATGPEDPAYLIYTSGTSSRPKGVLHAQRAIRGRQLMRDAWEGFRPGDIVMHAGTLNWSYTLGTGLMDTWMAGGHAVLYEGPHEPARWPGLLEQYRVTVFAGVPTVFRQILKYSEPADFDLSSLRHVLCAGESLLPPLLEAWRERAGTEMYEAFGMTEVSTYISTGPGMEVRPGSPGKPQPGRRVAIIPREGGTDPLSPGETGLIAVHRSDPGLMLGYWQRPEEEVEVYRGEWFTGGDLAAMDKDGYIWFKGRADDVINAFGVRLSPLEIETALASCPGVAEVGVIGLPAGDGKLLVTACVVPTRDGDDLTEEQLRAHAAEHLAGYKQPHQYVIRDHLPRTVSGKLLRSALVQELQDPSGSDG